MAEPNWLPFSLKSPDDWIHWYAAVRDQARTWGIWDYIDPERPDTALRTPPTEPPFPSPARIRPTALDILDLSDQEVSRYTVLTRDYDRQIDRYRHYQKAVDRMKQGIRSSVSSDNKRLIVSQSLRDVILMFRRMYAPTDSSRKRQVSKNWSNLRTQQPPRSNFDT
jgi:hypothetical protein